MNEKQRKIIIAGLLAIILMGAFPPWTYTFKLRNIYSEEPAGYGFIFSPPVPKSSTPTHGIKVDFDRLIIQLILAFSVTGLGVFISGTKDKSTGS